MTIFHIDITKLGLAHCKHALAHPIMPTAPTPSLSRPTSSMRGQLNGILFVALFAAAVTNLSQLPAIA